MDNKISFENTKTAFSYKTNRELQKSYFLFSSINNKLLVKLGTNIVNLAFKIKAPVKGIIRNTFFNQFCGGESIDECLDTIELLSKYNVGAILDYAVEGKDDDDEYDHTVEEIKKTIELSQRHENIPFCVFKPTGVASIDIMQKVHANNDLDSQEKAAYQKIEKRFYDLGKTAYDHRVRLFIDSEDSWIQRPIDRMVNSMMEEFNKETAYIFNTYQLYRKGMLENLVDISENARGKFKIGAKLVRGAYMEKERERAEEHGYEDPIMPDKQATDDQYNQALNYCVKNLDQVHFCSGSHNENSNLYLTQLMADNSIPKNDQRIYFAQLFGMSDNISFNLSAAGYNVVKYLPYGPVETTLPYLFRRAEENTSIAGQSSRELLLIRKELARRKSEN